MLQYLAEHYHLNEVRVVGVSSGAVCAALLLKLEEGDPTPQEVRQRCIELYNHFVQECRTKGSFNGPFQFVGKLMGFLEDMIPRVLPTNYTPTTTTTTTTTTSSPSSPITTTKKAEAWLQGDASTTTT